MNNKYITKRLEEFEKEFAHVRQTDRHYANPWIPEMKSFVIESIHQAVAEERERILDGLPEKKYFGKDYIEGSNSDSNYCLLYTSDAADE